MVLFYLWVIYSTTATGHLDQACGRPRRMNARSTFRIGRRPRPTALSSPSRPARASSSSALRSRLASLLPPSLPPPPRPTVALHAATIFIDGCSPSSSRRDAIDAVLSTWIRRTPIIFSPRAPVSPQPSGGNPGWCKRVEVLPRGIGEGQGYFKNRESRIGTPVGAPVGGLFEFLSRLNPPINSGARERANDRHSDSRIIDLLTRAQQFYTPAAFFDRLCRICW